MSVRLPTPPRRRTVLAHALGLALAALLPAATAQADPALDDSPTPVDGGMTAGSSGGSMIFSSVTTATKPVVSSSGSLTIGGDLIFSSVIISTPGWPVTDPHVPNSLVPDGSSSTSPYWTAVAGRALPMGAELTLGTDDTISTGDGNPVQAVLGRPTAANRLQISGGSIDAHTVMPPDGGGGGICCFVPMDGFTLQPVLSFSAWDPVTPVPVIAVGGVREVVLDAGSVSAHSGLNADTVGIALPDATDAVVRLNGGTLQVRVDGSDIPASSFMAGESPVAIGIGSLRWDWLVAVRGAGSVLIDGGALEVHLDTGSLVLPAAAGISDIAHVHLVAGSIDVQAASGVAWGVYNAHDLRIDGGSIGASGGSRGTGASAETVTMHGGTLSGTSIGLALLPSVERSLTLDGGTIRGGTADASLQVSGVSGLRNGTLSGGRIEVIAGSGDADAVLGISPDFSDPLHPVYDGGTVTLSGTDIRAQTDTGTAVGLSLFDFLVVSAGSVEASATGTDSGAIAAFSASHTQTGGSLQASAGRYATGVNATDFRFGGGSIRASTVQGLATGAITERALVSGGTITAHSDTGDATALAGYYSSNTNITLSMTDGTLSASTDGSGMARGLHRFGSLALGGGTVAATANGSGSAIGIDAGPLIAISGGRIVANSTSGAATGVLGTDGDDTVTLSGGRIAAHSSSGEALAVDLLGAGTDRLVFHGAGSAAVIEAGSLRGDPADTLRFEAATGTLNADLAHFGRVEVVDGSNVTLAGTTILADAFYVAPDSRLAFGPGSTLAAPASLEVAGSLAVNTTLALDLNLGAGARIGGNGTIRSLTLADGATLAPGNSIGTLHVSGALTLAAGSVYEVEADAAGNADRIVVGGTATLAGRVHVLAVPGRYRLATAYTILDAATLSGRFDAVSTDSAFLVPSLGYAATGVTLTLTRNRTGFADVARAPNARRVGALLDAAYPCCSSGLSASYDALLTLDAAGADAALDSLGAQLHADARSAARRTLAATRTRWLARLDAGGDGAWVLPHAGTLHQHGRDGLDGYRVRDGGLDLGLDRRSGDDGLGLAFGYDALDLDADRRGDADGRQATLGAWLQRRAGDWRLGTVLSAACYADERTRRVSDGAFSARARSRVAGQDYGAAIEAAWQPEAGLYPSLGLDVQHLRERAQREHGAGALNLTIDGAASTVVHAELAANLALRDGGQTLNARLGLRQRLSGAADTVRAQFTAAPAAGSFRSASPAADRSAAVAGLDWRYRLTPVTTLQARLDAAAGAHERAVQGGVGVELAW